MTVVAEGVVVVVVSSEGGSGIATLVRQITGRRRRNLADGSSARSCPQASGMFSSSLSVVVVVASCSFFVVVLLFCSLLMGLRSGLLVLRAASGFDCNGCGCCSCLGFETAIRGRQVEALLKEMFASQAAKHALARLVQAKVAAVTCDPFEILKS